MAFIKKPPENVSRTLQPEKPVSELFASQDESNANAKKPQTASGKAT